MIASTDIAAEGDPGMAASDSPPGPSSEPGSSRQLSDAIGRTSKVRMTVLQDNFSQLMAEFTSWQKDHTPARQPRLSSSSSSSGDMGPAPLSTEASAADAPPPRRQTFSPGEGVARRRSKSGSSPLLSPQRSKELEATAAVGAWQPTLDPLLESGRITLPETQPQEGDAGPGAQQQPAKQALTAGPAAAVDQPITQLAQAVRDSQLTHNQPSHNAPNKQPTPSRAGKVKGAGAKMLRQKVAPASAAHDAAAAVVQEAPATVSGAPGPMTAGTTVPPAAVNAPVAKTDAVSQPHDAVMGTPSQAQTAPQPDKRHVGMAVKKSSGHRSKTSSSSTQQPPVSQLQQQQQQRAGARPLDPQHPSQPASMQPAAQPVEARSQPLVGHKSNRAMLGRARVDAAPVNAAAGAGKDISSTAPAAALSSDASLPSVSRPMQLHMSVEAFVSRPVIERSVNMLPTPSAFALHEGSVRESDEWMGSPAAVSAAMRVLNTAVASQPSAEHAAAAAQLASQGAAAAAHAAAVSTGDKHMAGESAAPAPPMPAEAQPEAGNLTEHGPCSHPNSRIPRASASPIDQQHSGSAVRRGRRVPSASSSIPHATAATAATAAIAATASTHPSAADAAADASAEAAQTSTSSTQQAVSIGTAQSSTSTASEPPLLPAPEAIQHIKALQMLRHRAHTQPASHPPTASAAFFVPAPPDTAQDSSTRPPRHRRTVSAQPGEEQLASNRQEGAAVAVSPKRRNHSAGPHGSSAADGVHSQQAGSCSTSGHSNVVAEDAAGEESCGNACGAARRPAFAEKLARLKSRHQGLLSAEPSTVSVSEETQPVASPSGRTHHQRNQSRAQQQQAAADSNERYHQPHKRPPAPTSHQSFPMADGSSFGSSTAAPTQRPGALLLPHEKSRHEAFGDRPSVVGGLVVVPGSGPFSADTTPEGSSSGHVKTALPVLPLSPGSVAHVPISWPSLEQPPAKQAALWPAPVQQQQHQQQQDASGTRMRSRWNVEPNQPLQILAVPNIMLPIWGSPQEQSPWQQTQPQQQPLHQQQHPQQQLQQQHQQHHHRHHVSTTAVPGMQRAPSWLVAGLQQQQQQQQQQPRDAKRNSDPNNAQPPSWPDPGFLAVAHPARDRQLLRSQSDVQPHAPLASALAAGSSNILLPPLPNAPTAAALLEQMGSHAAAIAASNLMPEKLEPLRVPARRHSLAPAIVGRPSAGTQPDHDQQQQADAASAAAIARRRMEEQHKAFEGLSLEAVLKTGRSRKPPPFVANKMRKPDAAGGGDQ